VEAVRKVDGRAYPWGAKNIDTDIIIPAHWLKTTTREGLGKGAFESVRAQPGNIFDDPRYAGAPVLVAGDNFGCGSSREHAPWALLDFGVRCVISTSFADIFHNNCFKNGILPVVVSKEDLDKLMDDASRGANATITIDLEAQEIHGPDGGTVHFEVDEFKKHCLLNGLDDIGLTMEKADHIAAHEQRVAEERPWA
jgi:3-isopropylmalate/(R)-2-methylmalate dehydratase small subunit